MENKKDEILTPRQLINRHMKDLTHVVTEDEFRKLKVGSVDERLDTNVTDRKHNKPYPATHPS